MTYNYVTDHVTLTRLLSGVPTIVRMPGLDFVIAAMGRAGLIRLSVSQTEPTSNQPLIAWIKPDVPSYATEGNVNLWDADAAAYVDITADPTRGPELFGKYLINASGNASFVSGAGAPTAGDGKDGDYWLRTDAPGGTYGPKVAGAWPTNPLPGTKDDQIEVSGADPTVTDGSDGDWAVRTDAPGGLFYKVAGAWQLVPGSRSGIHTGTGAPSASLGEDGDVYLRDDTPGGVYIKSAGTWALQPNSDGDGEIHRGTGAPAGTLGDALDLYVREDTPFGIYQKDTGGTWQLIPNTTAAGSTAASETVAGVIEIADQTEADAATDDARALTPAKMAGIDPNSAMADALRGIVNESNGNVISYADASMAAPAATVGDDGDMALAHNTAGTAFKAYSKVGGAWVETFDSATAGASGASGGAFFEVTSAPGANNGADGDIAWDDVGGGDLNLYGPKAGGAWPANKTGWTQLRAPGSIGGTDTLTVPGGASEVVFMVETFAGEKSWDLAVNISGTTVIETVGAGTVTAIRVPVNSVETFFSDAGGPVYGTVTEFRVRQLFTGTNPNYSAWWR